MLFDLAPVYWENQPVVNLKKVFSISISDYPMGDGSMFLIHFNSDRNSSAIDTWEFTTEKKRDEAHKFIIKNFVVTKETFVDQSDPHDDKRL